MAPHPLHSIAVFLDLESLGNAGNTSGQLRKIQWFFTNTRRALASRGFEIAAAHAFASRHGRRTQPVPMKRQHRVSAVLQTSWKTNMTWTDDIADKAMIMEIERQLRTGALPRAVMIATNDADFAPTVAKLVWYRHFVLVSGTAMSAQLRRAASRAIPLKELFAHRLPAA